MCAEKDDFYERLILSKYKLLHRYAIRILKDTYLAEDMVMDTFHTAWIKIDELLVHENPDGWLFQTLKYKIGNYLASANRRAKHLIDMERDTLAAPEGSTASAGSNVHTLLLSIEEMLPPEDFAFLIAHYRDGLRYTQLAKQSNATVWSCRKRMQRIREHLRKYFPEYFHN